MVGLRTRRTRCALKKGESNERGKASFVLPRWLSSIVAARAQQTREPSIAAITGAGKLVLAAIVRLAHGATRRAR